MVDIRFFDTGFEALTGHPPLRWQRRLFMAFVDDRLPETLDLPTGLGKTSVMAIWLIALAAQASVPRRLVYIVDRRTVVDQATAFAERLRDNAGALRNGFEDIPISTLRGQFADNRRWLEAPSRAAMIIGTIDMIGSRLLFEAYGASRGMRPYHAGLLGADALIVLDEAHLCPPFEALLKSVTMECNRIRDPVPVCRLLSLSATGRGTEGDVFRLEPDEYSENFVRDRRTAEKRLALFTSEKDKKLESVLSELAWERATEGPPSRAADVMRECLRIGLPTPRVEAASQATPGWTVQRRAAQFDRRGWLVTLRFAVAVEGPFCLGRHRHFGMGAFAPES